MKAKSGALEYPVEIEQTNEALTRIELKRGEIILPRGTVVYFEGENVKLMEDTEFYIHPEARDQSGNIKLQIWLDDETLFDFGYARYI